MTKRGSLAGALVLSARFLAWARANGYKNAISDIEEARGVYKESGADTKRYEALSGAELTAARAKADLRLQRLTAEAERREGVTDEIPAESASGG